MKEKLKEILKSIPPLISVDYEGFSGKFNLDGDTFNLPYQSFQYQNEHIQGLREVNQRIALIKKQLSLLKICCRSYLDVGCSLGSFVSYFSRVFRDVVGIDSDAASIMLAKRIYPEIEDKLSCFDLNHNSLSNEFVGRRFDLITVLSVIEYIKDRERLAKDLHKLLNLNGLLIIEGHTMDINNGNDLIYQSILERYFSVKRFDNVTDPGLDTLKEAKGRPLWVCTNFT